MKKVLFRKSDKIKGKIFKKARFFDPNFRTFFRVFSLKKRKKMQNLPPKNRVFDFFAKKA